MGHSMRGSSELWGVFSAFVGDGEKVPRDISRVLYYHIHKPCYCPVQCVFGLFSISNVLCCLSDGFRLGLESDTIADWQLRAADYPTTNMTNFTSVPPAIKLNTDLSKSYFSITPSWRQASRSNWLEVDLLGVYLIKGLIVQGDGVEQAWTTQLRLEYSIKGTIDKGQSIYNKEPNLLVGDDQVMRHFFNESVTLNREWNCCCNAGLQWKGMHNRKLSRRYFFNETVTLDI